jgi:hypothetical protein
MFGKHQSYSIHLLIEYKLLLTHKYPIFSLHSCNPFLESPLGSEKIFYLFFPSFEKNVE